MNTIAEILTQWQTAQLGVIAARSKWKQTGKHEDLTAYVNAMEIRDGLPFQPPLPGI